MFRKRNFNFILNKVFKCKNIRLLNMGSNDSKSKILNLNFDNKVLKCLPIDIEKSNYIRTVNNALYSFVNPTPIKNPKLVSFSEKALELIDLNKQDIDNSFIEYFSGNQILIGSQPAAQCYAGHQFGLYAGQLGDGTVIYLGEIINNYNQRWEIQLKGAGLTPYSRFGDGRKTLRSSIREFLCSEGVFNIGISTTRALSCITSDDYCLRDTFYTGNHVLERCTVICRLAKTFIRFGTFEVFKKKDKYSGKFGPCLGRNDILIKLFDYVIDTFYNEISLKYPFENIEENDKQKRNLRCKEFFKELTKKTAQTVALWQCYGFCHGVLNTDNMSIVGSTLDYGPFAFMERYNSFFICNGSDTNGRYNYINQPDICKWNLYKLAEILEFFVPIEELNEILSSNFNKYFNEFYYEEMRNKLGLTNELKHNNGDVLCDKELLETLLDLLEIVGADLTNSFRNLNLIKDINKKELLSKQIDKYINEILNNNSLDFEDLKEEDKNILEFYNDAYLIKFDKRSNQNRLFSNVIKRIEEMKNLSKQDKKKNDEQRWRTWIDSYIKRIKYDLNENLNEESLTERINTMNKHNCKFILRNHIAQRAISLAEKGDYSEVNKVLKLLQNPFNDLNIDENEYFYKMANKDERCNKITCSS